MSNLEKLSSALADRYAILRELGVRRAARHPVGRPLGRSRARGGARRLGRRAGGPARRQDGRNDEAIALLQRAFANYYPFGTRLHIEPTFDALKDDPRWVALVTPQ